MGIAKPTPADASDFEMMNVFMPITAPAEFKRGPPELPGFIAASLNQLLIFAKKFSREKIENE